jgi:ArsR family transcriptional regulator
MYNVSQLAGELGLSQPTTSHHLKVLKHAGVVRCKKKCRDVFYWHDRAQLDQMLDEVRDQVTDR